MPLVDFPIAWAVRHLPEVTYWDTPIPSKRRSFDIAAKAKVEFDLRNKKKTIDTYVIGVWSSGWSEPKSSEISDVDYLVCVDPAYLLPNKNGDLEVRDNAGFSYSRIPLDRIVNIQILEKYKEKRNVTFGG